MLALSEPRIIERGPYLVVGAYCTFEGEDEGPGWSGASKTLGARRGEITNRRDDTVLGFLYRPHRDHPDIPDSVRACFMGVEVSDFDHVPDNLAADIHSDVALSRHLVTWSSLCYTILIPPTGAVYACQSLQLRSGWPGRCHRRG